VLISSLMMHQFLLVLEGNWSPHDTDGTEAMTTELNLGWSGFQIEIR
jgi:hypothetical protein